MSEEKVSVSAKNRTIIAFGTMIFAATAITVLAIVTICNTKDEGIALTVFNIVLPVMATWVGTILAFYFGRENFEAANKQVREMVEQLSPEQRARSLVKSIMRGIFNMVIFEIPKGITEDKVLLSELRKKFSVHINRLPILDSNKKPLYMIHESRIDNYIISGGTEKDSLKKFIEVQKEKGYSLGLDEGFIIVAENATLESAKQSLKEKKACMDIFVTKEGSPAEPLSGWISNIRMEKYFQ